MNCLSGLQFFALQASLISFYVTHKKCVGKNGASVKAFNKQTDCRDDCRG